MSLTQRIDALLPQTQCGKCGHQGCKPYAQGIAAGEPINKCPPGGDETIIALADLLGRPVIALDPTRGPAPAQVAYIREAECIGCTKCIQACPVDAIVGAAKLMHTVLVDECTGCDLCVAPCPVDCIELRPLEGTGATPMTGGSANDELQRNARDARRRQARGRFEQRNARLAREEERKRQERAGRIARAQPPAAPAPSATPEEGAPNDDERALKQAKIAVAMSRAQWARAEKAFGPAPTSEQRETLRRLQQALDVAQSQLAALQPAKSVSAGTPDVAALKRAKIALAIARADLARLERDDSSTAEAVEAARLQVRTQELALNRLSG